MSGTPEVTRDTINEFIPLQEAMLAAREERAEKTYAILKRRYTFLKATLSALGVNLAQIDEINE